ncbi:MAG TPA: sporulation protein, partial [Comamonadaceae bacterium]|nr:sporulation protein [Comamonadaceae bacterium]
MAFFKFRWPGKPEAQADKAKPAKRTSSSSASRTAQAESLEDMRRRARHRLIGAAVLVLAGVVGFPLL